MQKTQVRSLGQEDPRRKDRLLMPVFLGLPAGSDGKESVCNVGDLGSTPGLGKSPGEGNGYSLQYSCLENPMVEEPGRLQSMGSQRVGHDVATKPPPQG